MKFFSECKTVEEAKATFRKLAKVFHPDKQGNQDLMIELQKQYDSWQAPFDMFKSQNTGSSSYWDFGELTKNPQGNQRDIPFDHPIHNTINHWKGECNQMQRFLDDKSKTIAVLEAQKRILEQEKSILEKEQKEIIRVNLRLVDQLETPWIVRLWRTMKKGVRDEKPR